MPETNADWFLQHWIDSFDGSTKYPAHSIYQPITSPIHQTGKTSFALREAEIVLERLKGRKFDPANISFTISDFMDRRHEIDRYDIQILDEPQRAASSRSWHNEDQNILAEDLMASNRYIKPAIFPTPLNAMVDNRLFDIATSQVVIPILAHADIYYLDRGQLDRKSSKVRTPKLGTLTFDKPSATLWHSYQTLFNDDYEKRNKRARERVNAIQKEAEKEVSILQAGDLVGLIMEKPEDFIGKQGNISPSKVQVHFKVPYNRAQEAATDATTQLKARVELEQAEKED